MKKSLNCNGRLVDLSTPAVMGILNLTPDSFHDGGKYIQNEVYLHHVESMLKSGALFIDIGAQSTRPGSTRLSAQEEWERLETALLKLLKEFPEAYFSIDSYHALVVKRAVSAGAALINDISGGEMDPEMFPTIAQLNVPYVMMHLQGTPESMQVAPVYDDVVSEVIDYFNERIRKLTGMGHTDILIDPGFGFGKTIAHNYELLHKLDLLKITGKPVLAGLSRKSMITKVLGISSKEALNGTTVLNTIALMKGADIIRVHDVKEAVEAINLVRQLGTV